MAARIAAPDAIRRVSNATLKPSREELASAGSTKSGSAPGGYSSAKSR